MNEQNDKKDAASNGGMSKPDQMKPPKEFRRPSADGGAKPPPSRYIQTSEDDKDSTSEMVLVIICWFLVILMFPLSIMVDFSVVYQLLMSNSTSISPRKGLRGPGLVFILPCIDEIHRVDMRTDVANVRPQDVLTKDSVTITVNAVVYYSIYSPIDSIIQVDDAKQATELISQVTLRNVVGSKTLNVLLTSRQQLSREIQQAVSGITYRWGVRVERVDVMDITLPTSLERSLASEAEAVREARAKIILAEGELKASKALKEASDVMSENKITLQLRHLQILSSIASERRVRIIYPIPLEIMEPFMTGKEGQKKDGDGGSGGGKETKRDDDAGGSTETRKEGGGPVRFTDGSSGGILSRFIFAGKDEKQQTSTAGDKSSDPNEPSSSKSVLDGTGEVLALNQKTHEGQEERMDEENRRPTYVAYEMESVKRSPAKFADDVDTAEANQKRTAPRRPGGLAFMDLQSYRDFLQTRW
ncbi:band 7 protein AGAP004871 isoform X2 [Drosophila santomea]|uniref:band 7 protein AGAP004871 isoform X2 n=1 Tax=Drosophila santomea TaxID=129105 RepID=UPI001952DD26|nr:band 7 protein AGAP004871 isoform X2 [Drosophila santomea]